MECLIGIAFKDFVLLASDKSIMHSIVVMKTDEKKQYALSDHLIMAVSGEPGDTVQFAEFIAKNIQLYKMRNGYELSPLAAANFTRKHLADYLRSRTPYRANLLLAGYEKEEGPGLYFIDYLATMAQLPYSVHGYGAYFTLGVLDKYYRYDMSEEDGVELLRKCMKELQQRFVISLPVFQVSMVNKDGIHTLSDLSAK